VRLKSPYAEGLEPALEFHVSFSENELPESFPQGNCERQNDLTVEKEKESMT